MVGADRCRGLARRVFLVVVPVLVLALASPDSGVAAPVAAAGGAKAGPVKTAASSQTSAQGSSQGAARAKTKAGAGKKAPATAASKGGPSGSARAKPPARQNKPAAAVRPGAPPKAALPKAAAPKTADTAGTADAVLKSFPVSLVPPMSPAKDAKLPVPGVWTPLMERLAKDGVDRLYLRGLFGRLGDVYSPVPMGKKINELFVNKYMSAPRKAPTPGGAPAVYKSLLLPASVEKCKLYLVAHERAFTAMEARYGVPRGIVAGLLMVETRLGSYVGENSAFWSLACLAASDSPERVQTVVQELPLPMTPDKEEWLAALLKARSAWAYKELLALISHSRDQDADPLSVPGSIYGAIGLCQFMPSNLRLFAVDGNNDGKVDLFDPEDAIPSVANYLKLHGWEGTGRETRHASLKRYNKSNIYANTILALGEAIVSPAETAAGGAKAAPAKVTVGKKTAPAKVTVGKKTVPVKAAAGKTVAPGAQRAQGKSQVQAPGKAPGKTPGKSSGAGKDGRGKVETPRAAPSSIKS